MLYRNVFIKSEEDLPKKVGAYLVLLKNGSGRLLHFPFDGDVGYNISKYDWLDTVDWYLQPIDELTDREIDKKIFEVCSEMRPWNGKTSPTTAPEMLKEFAIWYRDKMKGK